VSRPHRYNPFGSRAEARKVAVASSGRSDPDQEDVDLAVKLLLRGDDEEAARITHPELAAWLHPAREPPPPPEVTEDDVAAYDKWVELQRLRSVYRLKSRAKDFTYDHFLAVDKATRRLADYALSLDPAVHTDTERYFETFHTRPPPPTRAVPKHFRTLHAARPELLRQRRDDAYRASARRGDEPLEVKSVKLRPRKTQQHRKKKGKLTTGSAPDKCYTAKTLRVYLTMKGLPSPHFLDGDPMDYV